MKKITFITFQLFAFSLFAQPVINISDINSLNTSGDIFSSVSSIQISNSGPNQIWDYSSLPLTFEGSSSNNAVLTAPFASDFPNSNFFIYSYTDVGNFNYGYYNLTNNKLEVNGVSDDTGVILTFSNPQTIFEFPFAFNSTFTDDYEITVIPTVFTTTTTYDAYGTLTTAFGTFTDVIRLKQNNNGNIGYNWIKLNPYKDLMSANLNSANNTVNYTIIEQIPLSNIKNESKYNFSIYPNSTSGILTIKNLIFSERETFVNVFDILGNLIINNLKIDNNSKEINLSNFASGVYFVKISDINNNILQTEKIIKK